MIERCYNQNEVGYARYGAKGVYVCDRWRDASAFIEDNIKAYEDHAAIYGERETTIDRIDGTRDYEPGNIRWATYLVNNGNKPCIKKLTYQGESLSAADWGRRLGIRGQIIASRVRNGWTTERALTERVRAARNKGKASKNTSLGL